MHVIELDKSVRTPAARGDWSPRLKTQVVPNLGGKYVVVVCSFLPIALAKRPRRIALEPIQADRAHNNAPQRSG